MRLLGDSVGCAANAGKIGLYSGNPLAFNYAQWLALLRSSVVVFADTLESATTVLIDRAQANELALEEQWDDLYASLLRSASEGSGLVQP